MCAKEKNEFPKEHVGIKVNSSSKHKKIFDTANESNKWLEGLKFSVMKKQITWEKI